MRAVEHLKYSCLIHAPSPPSEAQDQRERIASSRPHNHPGCAWAGDHSALRGSRLSPSPGGVDPGLPATASCHCEVRRVVGGRAMISWDCVPSGGCRVHEGTRLLGRDMWRESLALSGQCSVLCQDLRQPIGMALALLPKESRARTTRLFFHHTNICCDGAAAPDPLCACPGCRAEVGKRRRLQHGSSAPLTHPPSCTFLLCAVTVPGDGGSLREVLD